MVSKVYYNLAMCCYYAWFWMTVVFLCITISIRTWLERNSGDNYLSVTRVSLRRILQCYWSVLYLMDTRCLKSFVRTRSVFLIWSKVCWSTITCVGLPGSGSTWKMQSSLDAENVIKPNFVGLCWVENNHTREREKTCLIKREPFK